MQAIASQESGGNHELINSDSGASGKWQVMPENIPSWSKAALGREISQAEFIGSAQIQTAIVKHRLNLYLTEETQPERSVEEIVRRVASAWYSGQPKLWNNTKPQYSNGREYPQLLSTQPQYGICTNQKRLNSLKLKPSSALGLNQC
jgi:hypothetical protein